MSSVNLQAPMVHNSRTCRRSPMSFLVAALPVLCLSGVASMLLYSPCIVPVAADYVDESEMDIKELENRWKNQGDNYFTQTLADFIKNAYGGAIDGYRAERWYTKISVERNIGGGRLERMGLATHASDVPESAAYNMFFDGFENKTNSRYFWRESIVNGYNKGSYSIGEEILHGGAEHFNDHGLFFKDKGERYAIYALLTHYDNNHRFNYRYNLVPHKFHPQVYQFEVAFTEGLTCGAAQLKLFNNHVTRSHRWMTFEKQRALKMKRPVGDYGRMTGRELKDEDTSSLWEYITIDEENNALENDIMPWNVDDDDSVAPVEPDRSLRTMKQYRSQNQLGNHTEAHIVFGPERCNGTENVAVHVKSYYKINDELRSVTHTLQKNISLPMHDNLTHVYTLELNPTLQAYFVYVDTILVATGDLDEDFDPPFKGPKMVPVAGFGKSLKPENYNETHYGPWEEPMEQNFLWSEAKERIEFGGLFDNVPYIASAAVALGFEMQTGEPGILVDNVYFSVGSNATNALSFAKKSWRLKYAEQYKASFPDFNPVFWWDKDPFLTSFLFAGAKLLLPQNGFGATIMSGYVMPLVHLSFNENPDAQWLAQWIIIAVLCVLVVLFLVLFVVSFVVYDMICALLGYFWTIPSLLFRVIFGGKKEKTATTIKKSGGGSNVSENDHDGGNDVIEATGAAGTAAPPPRRRLRTRRD